MRMVFLWLAVVGCGSLLGCGAISGVKDPKAEVTGLALQQQTEYGARMDLLVTLTNPNKVPLPVERASYWVQVEGLGQYSFTDVPHRTIPAGGSQVVRLPVAVPGNASLAGKQASAGGTFTYNPPGEVRKLLTDSRVPLPSFSFDGRSEVR